MGEHALIAAFETLLRVRSPRILRWVGDDAAVVRARPIAVTSVDQMVDGVHFRLDHPRVAAADVGHRALAGALSDLAAMGVEAGEAYVALGLPPGLGHEDVLALVGGMEALAAACAAAGGAGPPGGRAGPPGGGWGGGGGRPPAPPARPARGGARGGRGRGAPPPPPPPTTGRSCG